MCVCVCFFQAKKGSKWVQTVPEYSAPGVVVSGAAKAGVPAGPESNSPAALNSALTPKSATLM